MNKTRKTTKKRAGKSELRAHSIVVHKDRDVALFYNLEAVHKLLLNLTACFPEIEIHLRNDEPEFKCIGMSIKH